MFGNPLYAKAADALMRQRQNAPMDAMERSIKTSAPQAAPRWATALQGIGATMQDVGASLDGRPTGAIDHFNQAQARMREATDDARRRQLRFQQLRETIPSSDSAFWQAYALGGEEAALQALQARQGHERQRDLVGYEYGLRGEEAQRGREFESRERAADRDVTMRGQNISAANAAADRELRVAEMNMPPAVVRTIDAMGLEGEERRRALALATGVEQPRNSRDAIIAHAANDMLGRYPDGNFPQEEVARLRNLTDAIYQSGPQGNNMSLSDAYIMASMSPQERAELAALMRGEPVFDLTTVSLEEMEAELSRRQNLSTTGQ